jgi:hypothetical protein
MKRTIKIAGMTVKGAVKVIKHHDVPEHVRIGIRTIDKPIVKKQPKVNVTVDMKPIIERSPDWLQESINNIRFRSRFI